MQTTPETTLQRYTKIFPEEAIRLNTLFSCIKASNISVLLLRSTLPGHITASGFIFDTKSQKMLFISHAFLKKILQPGGHVENTDRNILETAYREIFEEISIKKQELRLVPVDNECIFTPTHIDIHSIPKNDMKKEPDHLHYDFQYFFFLKPLKKAVRNTTKKIKNIEWIPFETFSKMQEFQSISQKIQLVIKTDCH